MNDRVLNHQQHLSRIAKQLLGLVEELAEDLLLGRITAKQAQETLAGIIAD